MGDFPLQILTDYLELKETLTNENLKPFKNILNEILENNEPFLISHLKINGDELKSLGVSGRKIGENLELLKNFVIDNPENNTKEKLLDFLKQN